MQSRTIRLLIVEDNPGDAALLRRMLAAFDEALFEVEHAPRLSAAVELLGSMRFDAVLLDLDLPDSRELNTLVALRPCAGSVPIIVVTGLEDRQKALEALSCGAQDYLVKGTVDARLLGRAILRRLSPLSAVGA